MLSPSSYLSIVDTIRAEEQTLVLCLHEVVVHILATAPDVLVIDVYLADGLGHLREKLEELFALLADAFHLQSHQSEECVLLTIFWQTPQWQCIKHLRHGDQCVLRAAASPSPLMHLARR